MTTLYLIRHAEAEGNLYRRVHGQYNSLVTDNGYRQIKALEARFRDVKIDAVYSSDLFRTMTTARSVYVPKGLPLHTRSDLREVSMGDWEDRSWAGVDRHDHQRMKLFASSSPDFRAPGGESYVDIRRRGVAALLDIAANHPGQTVAVFSHGTIMRHTLAELRGIGLGPEAMAQTRHSDNTAVTKLEIDGGAVHVVYSDDNSHLTEAISTLAQQHWWKGNGRVDVNLWYQPLDLSTAAGQSYYARCREEAWRNLYGNLDRYTGKGFLADAMTLSRSDPNSVWIAMWGGKNAGVLQLDPTRDARDKAGYISFLYLCPELRSQGVGVQLVGKAVSVFRPRGRDRLRLVCSEANEHALRFYKKYGFRVTGTEPGAYASLYEMEKYIGYEYQGELD